MGVRIVGFAHCSSRSSRKYGWPSGPLPRIWAHSWMACSHRGASLWRICVACGKGWSSVGQPSSSVVIGILDVIVVDICLPDQISMPPMGCRSAVSRVATFLPITDGNVARPLCVWKASSSGQCLNFVAACVYEARAVAPRAPSSLSSWVHERIAEPH